MKLRSSQMETKGDDLNRDSPSASLPDPWEAAYLRFETPEQEVQKFVLRLQKLGAAQWPRDAENRGAVLRARQWIERAGAARFYSHRRRGFVPPADRAESRFRKMFRRRL